MSVDDTIRRYASGAVSDEELARRLREEPALFDAACRYLAEREAPGLEAHLAPAYLATPLPFQSFL